MIRVFLLFILILQAKKKKKKKQNKLSFFQVKNGNKKINQRIKIVIGNIIEGCNKCWKQEKPSFGKNR